MIQSSTFLFLKEVAENNNREWFADNKTKYTAAQADAQGFAEALLTKMKLEDPTLEGQDAKKCLMRIYRDVRFSKNKEPYKTNFGIGFSIDGKNGSKAGYYVHIAEGESFVAGGMWQPLPDQLQKIRQEIDYNGVEFAKIMNSKAFAAAQLELNMLPTLKNPPKGYTSAHPMLMYLKLTSFTASAMMTQSNLSSASSTALVLKKLTALQPFINFINRAVT